MNTGDFHVDRISFNTGTRAYAPDFSICIPDTWNIFTAGEDGDRVFKAYPAEITQQDIDDEGEYGLDGIFYCEMPSLDNDDVKETLQDHGIDEFVRAMVRLMRDGDSNPTSSATTKLEFVKGENCYVMVARVDTNAGKASMAGDLGNAPASDDDEIPDGYDIWIIPCMPFSYNYVRLCCPTQSSKHADDAFAKACEMAKTVKLADPLVCDVIADINRCKSEKVDADFFVEATNKLLNTLGAARELERRPAGERFVREIRQAISKGEVSNTDDLPSGSEHTIEFFSDFANRTTYYVYELLDAYGYQKEHGVSPQDAQRMIESIGEFMTLYEANLSDDDPKEQAKIDKLGNIRKPDDYEKLRDLIEKEYPGYKSKHDTVREGQLEKEDTSPKPADEETSNEPQPASTGGYSDWWAPFPDDREPYYGGYNQQFDHNAACWLLYQDCIFFNDNEISWDGHHHALAGMQVNATYADQIPVFLERADNYAPALVDFMTTIEQDEGLIIPREMIHPVTQNALREGDLTGITLLNLQACAKSLMITSTAPHQYNVIVDPRVLAGIPDFLNLMGRLIWDMREYNGVEVPFSVTLLGTRNFDANVFYGDDGFLDKPVAGATTELCATFSEKPTITLPGEEEIEIANLPFASGFDKPDEMQSDEDFFEDSLMFTINSFPLTVAIEGTHYLGRAKRIEDIKVGDKLVLASDWENKWFTPCCIEVFNDKGETLGNLNEQSPISMSGNRELALLLPYITATVESVTPLSQRRKNAKYALMDVHMELDESVKPEQFGPVDPAVISKAKETLRLPKAERITMSKSPLSYADLKGSIDTSSMPAISENFGKDVRPDTANIATGQVDDHAAKEQSDGQIPPDEKAPAEPSRVIGYGPLAIDQLEDAIPQQLAKCVRMCQRNVVGFDFFAETFDWLKQIALGQLDQEHAKLVAQCSVDALRAQAFKGADAGELELMHLETESVVVELNAKHGFDMNGTMLHEANKSTLEELSEGAEERAAATRLVDALSLAYWDVTTKLVDVLIEVVGKKTDEQYEKDLAEWQKSADELRAELGNERDQLKSLESKAKDAAGKVSDIKARLAKAEEQEQERYQIKALIADARKESEKAADAQLAKQEAVDKQNALSGEISACEAELSNLGVLAFGKKKAKRQEIEEKRAALRKIVDEVAAREKELSALLERAGKQESLELELKGMPEDQRTSIKDELEQAKRMASKADGEVAIFKQACSAIEGRISQHDKDKPSKSSYLPSAAKAALRWRPAIAPGQASRTSAAAGTSTKSPSLGNSSGSSASAYKKGTSKWRSRRPSFSDSNPNHMTGSGLSGHNGSSYSASVGYQLNIDKPDMTHRMDIDVEGPARAFDDANAFLSEVSSAFRSRNYTGEFSFLRDFKCSRLPFTSIDTRLYVSALDADEVSPAIGLIGAVNSKFPELAFDGVVEMVRSYAGLRTIYYITSRAGSSTVNVEQKVDGLR